LREEDRTRGELRTTAFPDLSCGDAVAVCEERFANGFGAEDAGGVEEGFGVDVVLDVGYSGVF